MRALVCLLALLTCFWSGTATAHFLSDSQTRELHVIEGPQVLMRFPSTLSFAAALSDPLPEDGIIRAPYLNHEIISDLPYYRVDLEAARADPGSFEAFVLKDYRFSVDGVTLQPVVEDWALTEGARPPGRESIEAGLAEPDWAEGYIADTDIVLRLILPGLDSMAALTVEVVTPAIADLPEDLAFDTHVTDHRLPPPLIMSRDGFWPEPIIISPRPLSAFTHWVWQGALHIVGGLDHLLFVLCLALAAPSLKGLGWSVTGFTLGHSVTLSAGVLGLVPEAGWFIPAVELGVALSILAMAGLVLLRRGGAMRFTLAAGLGLLHGFGFAFMLSPMIGEGGLALPLAGFNIGVELGQLAIVAVAFTLLVLADGRAQRLGRNLRLGVAAAAAVIALAMCVERTLGLVAMFPNA